MRRLRGPNCLYQKQCNNCNFITDHGRAGDLSRSSHVSKCSCEVKVSQSCPTLCDPMDCIARGILQARILKLSSLSFLQGIFPTQGSNPGIPHGRQILYRLSHKGSPSALHTLNHLIFTTTHIRWTMLLSPFYRWEN